MIHLADVAAIHYNQVAMTAMKDFKKICLDIAFKHVLIINSMIILQNHVNSVIKNALLVLEVVIKSAIHVNKDIHSATMHVQLVIQMDMNQFKEDVVRFLR